MLFLTIDQTGILQAKRYCSMLGSINPLTINRSEGGSLPTLNQFWQLMILPENKQCAIACAPKLDMKDYLGRAIALPASEITWPEGGVYGIWPKETHHVQDICRLNIEGGLKRVGNGYTPCSLYPTEDANYYTMEAWDRRTNAIILSF